MPSNKDVIILDGTVREQFPNTTFLVELANKRRVLAYVSGKMRLHFIKILPGDVVTLEISPYDLNKGRIILRKKEKVV